MSEPIKILLVDDHPLVREGLATLIAQQPDFLVCGQAGTPPEAMQLVAATQPDVVIVDISLENASGLELLKNLKATHPTLKTLVLSMHDESLYAERALHAGARGYLMKREAAQRIIAGIRAVHAGQLFVSAAIAARLAEKFVSGANSATRSPADLLSDRELEVFELLGRGQSTRLISEQLNMGFKTVQTHQARIKEKLQLANATELLRAAIQWHEAQTQK